MGDLFKQQLIQSASKENQSQILGMTTQLTNAKAVSLLALLSSLLGSFLKLLGSILQNASEGIFP